MTDIDVWTSLTAYFTGETPVYCSEYSCQGKNLLSTANIP